MTSRQQWIVQYITDDGTITAREASSGRKLPRTVRLPADYVARMLSCRMRRPRTGAGRRAQCATTDRSHTILTDATSAASAYVTIMRGRESNLLHIIANSQTEARAQFVAAMRRDRADRGPADATRSATDEVAGLIADGPVKLVNAEVAALMKQAATAEVQAERWQQVSTALAEHGSTKTRTRDARQQLTNEWGELPRWNERAGAWGERVTHPKIDTDPRLIEAEQAHRVTHD